MCCEREREMRVYVGVREREGELPHPLSRVRLVFRTQWNIFQFSREEQSAQVATTAAAAPIEDNFCRQNKKRFLAEWNRCQNKLNKKLNRLKSFVSTNFKLKKMGKRTVSWRVLANWRNNECENFNKNNNSFDLKKQKMKRRSRTKIKFFGPSEK